MKVRLLTCLSRQERHALVRHFSPALLTAVWFAPAGWVTRALMRLSDGAMLTWADTIYCKAPEAATTSRAEWLALVAHEVKHVEQFRRLGKWQFAWRYARQWLRGGYMNVELEKEAYSFQWQVEDEIREALA